MKKLMMLLCAFAAGAAMAEPKVVSIAARQHYPWNGMADVDVTFYGASNEVAEAECAFVATNAATRAELSVAHIAAVDGATGGGMSWKRSFVWDIAADIDEEEIDDIELSVVAKPYGCVQLWEGGPFWAECNLGAGEPEESGYYFWWGDTVGYGVNTNNATWRDSGYWHEVDWVSSTGVVMSESPFDSAKCSTYSKSVIDLSSEGYIDSSLRLVPEYDAVTTCLGAAWRLPTADEFHALTNNCDVMMTSVNGVTGLLVIGRGAYSSKSIFLPAAGYGEHSVTASRIWDDLKSPGTAGRYWSSVPSSLSNPGAKTSNAQACHFSSGLIKVDGYYRQTGQSVRPVSESAPSVSVITRLTLDTSPGEPVEFRDYDANTGTFTNAVRECALVTSATRVLYDGWYAVQGTVTIPADANLTVAGTVHLILCDGAKLSVEKPAENNAGVCVQGDASLVIYGQTAGTGALTAAGGSHAAGIGGCYNGNGGVVTINGGTVTAQSGSLGAGIGGGQYGAGGTVTINGGVVTASGSNYGTGIGSGDLGSEGVVTIDGGAIDADSMRGGIRIRGGIFKYEPQAGWLGLHCVVSENPDETTKGKYPFAVKGIDFPYLDWDPVSKKMTNAVVRASDWIEVTDATRTLENGKWYAVTNHIVFPDGANLSVDGSAHLILCDGVSLTIPKPSDNNAAVKVSGGSSLTIYGQTAGTGALTAVSGEHGAGIGGDCDGAGGMVTINGGMVSATGVGYSAGIGGGRLGKGGAVTVNGGRVTAQGGDFGAGIGGGFHASGGTVTINGGAVAAVGNGGSDIGPGYGGDDGTVAISGGIFARPVKIEWIAEGYAIGGNSDSATSAAYPYAVTPAAFTVTISDHPHSIAQLTYGNGAVTSLVTNTSFKLGTGMTGVSVIFTPEHGYCFAVEDETGVRTLPSPVIEDCTVEAPAVEEMPCEVTFAVGAGIRRAAYVCGGVTNELVTGESARIVQLGTRVELIVEELPHYYPFAGARTFMVEQETMRVEIFASPIPKGMEGNPFQIGADVFASTNAAGVMTITGTGAMSNFVSATDVPWAPETVTAVTIAAEVAQIGANAWSGMDDSVVINGTALSAVRYLAPGVDSADPAGAISPAEFERIDIIDGKAYLGVSVFTNSEVKVKGEGWGVATNGVIEVPAPGKRGFFILKSKGVAK